MAELGEIIRRQRELNELSMRQFARAAGISNPYLSQIERGLREPSERVMDAIASALEVTTDALYEQAGRPRDEEPAARPVVDAIRADTALTGRQRQAMIEVYEAFVGEGGRSRRNPRRGPEST